MVPPVVTGHTPLLANVVVDAIGEVSIIRIVDEALFIVVEMVVPNTGIVRVPEGAAASLAEKGSNLLEGILLPGKSRPGYRPSYRIHYGAEWVVDRTNRPIRGTSLREVALAFQGVGTVVV